MATAPVEAFGERWNALEQTDRIYIRRMVRMGRRLPDARLAEMGVGWSEWWLGRRHNRSPFFWVWFVPAVLMAAAAGTRVHPLVAGLVLGLAAQHLAMRVSIKRARRINAPLLDAGPA